MRHERARSTLAALPRTPDDVFSFRNLYRAAKVCSKGTLWKSGAMKFDRHRAVNCARLRESLLTGRFRRQPPVRFTLCERGKVRHIVGPRYRDRIVQRCLCDVLLVPAVSRSLVYSNAASLKGKGTSFARKRFERDLLAARCRYGADARVFQYDVHNYFGSVPSERAFDLISSAVRSLLSAPDETSGVTGLLEVAELYVCEAPYLTLGNQVNQLAAIAYLNGLDHAFHERLELDGAGRYMDDGYVFCPVEVLDDVRCLFRDSLAAAGLTPNRKACFGFDRAGVSRGQASCPNRLSMRPWRASRASSRSPRPVMRQTLGQGSWASLLFIVTDRDS